MHQCNVSASISASAYQRNGANGGCSNQWRGGSANLAAGGGVYGVAYDGCGGYSSARRQWLAIRNAAMAFIGYYGGWRLSWRRIRRHRRLIGGVMWRAVAAANGGGVSSSGGIGGNGGGGYRRRLSHLAQ